MSGKHSRVEDPGMPGYDQRRDIDVYPAGGEAGRRARWYLTEDPFSGSATRPQPSAGTGQVHSPDPHLGAVEDIGGHRAPRQRNLLLGWASARSLVLAAVTLVALSLLAKGVDTGSGQSRAPWGAGPTSSGRSIAPAPGPTTAVASRSAGQPSSADHPVAAASRRVVVVPNSICHRYVEARTDITPLIVSVQNSCQ